MKFRTISKFFGVFTLLVLSVMASGLRAADWPQWLGPQRDGEWRETGIIEKFPAGRPKVLWRAPVGAGYSGPAVAEGRVFLMDRILAKGVSNPPEPIPSRPKKGIPGSERILCFDAKDGKMLWKHEYDCPYHISYPLGPRTTPAVHEHRVYALGAEGSLFCLEEDTGKVVWSRDFKKDYKAETPIWGHAAHPLIDGDKLICLVGGKDSTVVAFDKNTGKELWKALDAREPGYCPPVIHQVGSQRQLIIWHPEAINGLDPETGKLFWSVPQKSYQGMTISTPRRVGDNLFFTGYGPPYGIAVMLKPQADTVEVVWKGSAKIGLNTVFSMPFAEGDYLYGNIHGGKLACIKAATGERLWETLDVIGGKPLPSGDSFLVKNGDRFFIANEHGDLIIAQLSPKGYREISRVHLLEPTSAAWGRPVLWSHPAFADKGVFMRNDKELIRVSLAR